MELNYYHYVDLVYMLIDLREKVAVAVGMGREAHLPSNENLVKDSLEI